MSGNIRSRNFQTPLRLMRKYSRRLKRRFQKSKMESKMEATVHRQVLEAALSEEVAEAELAVPWIHLKNRKLKRTAELKAKHRKKK